ncbi:MAG: hypothetical protein LLG01_06965 [Planctomycetaceae bacterium]|nr:hypothetical protein [Planctomycetaceae bacterium]
MIHIETENVLVAVGGAVAIVVLYNFAWYLIEIVHPLEYRGVRPEELAEHFEQLRLRGGSGTCMIVTDEATGKTLRVRKKFYQGEADCHLDVILDCLRTDAPQAKESALRLKALGVRVSRGTTDAKFLNYMSCKCGQSPDKAMKAAQEAFRAVYGASTSPRFSIRVQGFIRGDMKPYNGAMTFSDARYGSPGRPYKQFQRRPGLLYWLKQLAKSLSS